MGQYQNPRAKAGKELEVQVVPNQIIADATTAARVGKGSLCRIKGIADEFVKFGPTGVDVPSVSTKETFETEAGFFYISATDDFIRTSAAMRIEVIDD